MNTKHMIKETYSTFTKTEKRVADYLLNNHEIDYLRLAELANHLKVGEATIIRFCRKLKFKGYQDFKFSIALDEAKEKGEIHE